MLTNSQHDQLMREYERIRDVNHALAEEHRETAYEKIPALSELDASVGSLSVSAARALLNGDEEAVARLHEEIAKIGTRRQALLVGAGFPADFLDPIYDCKFCHDTGFLPGEDGTPVKCSCFRQREVMINYSMSNIEKIIQEADFDEISLDYQQGEDRQNLEKAVSFCRSFVQNFKKCEQDYSNILIYGNVGTGKSLLAGCIAKQVLADGNSVIYFSAVRFFELMGFYSFDNKDKTAAQSFLDDIYSCDLFILDDLGTELSNQFISSKLFSIINERALRDKSTVITTNLSFRDLQERYSDRNFSRLLSSFKTLKVSGTDVRLLKRRLGTPS